MECSLGCEIKPIVYMWKEIGEGDWASAEKNGKKVTKRFSCMSDAKDWLDLVRKDLHGEFCNNL